MSTQKRAAEDSPTEDENMSIIDKHKNKKTEKDLIVCGNCKSANRVNILSCQYRLCTPCIVKRVVNTMNITNGNCSFTTCCKKTHNMNYPVDTPF